MSQPPDAPDPYLPPPDGRYPVVQPHQAPQPYGQDEEPQAVTGGGWGGGRPSQAEVRADKPAPVVQLGQVMVAGGVLAVLAGAYPLLNLDSAVSELAAQVQPGDLEQAGLDPDSFEGAFRALGVTVLAVSTVITAGFWFLFAWLFGRGQGRVLGTVLGAVNGLFTFAAVFLGSDVVELVLQLITIAVVVGAMVLLWHPTTSAWFRAVAAADRSIPWS